MINTIVIVGAGQCGASAAETLRNEGFDGTLILIGDEDDPPYERPPLSKEYLQGKQDREELLIRSREWYRDAGIELRTGSAATSLDLDAGVVRLSDGDRVSFDRLLLATGGRARTLPGDYQRVRYLRSLADADRLRTELPAAGHVVIVGAGFIGAELAASARSLGIDVTMLEALEVPMARVLGTEIGAVYADIHRDQGVRLHTGEGLASITESADGTVRVRTTREQVIDCDLVVVGIGITPNSELAQAAGITTDNGIVVDQFCRTSAPHVYAAGDVANHFHPLFGRRLRVEHYDNAIRQGAAAARNMLGKDVVFDECHWFWSDQYDVNLQYTGHCPQWDEIVVRGSLEERRFTAFYLNHGIVNAALALNRPKDILRAKKMIRARTPVDVAKLRDEDVDLRKLLQQPA
ncbi:Ferredoxin--NAD(+) reductase [Carbonactinospora thermoautotrophica]|uniref:Ferredoxin--NAD(+) reductase n=1 Tax=Carbonactinospora thermoautotrophica TaxID=1469144 RepID=A0A132MRD9_9ACTN|nr:FAD-dependent oxidoreductase [Carbonactinospora thermoautotrophica]KWW99961.1 Ferredoxin--NAD(+) reductase [Carbonactinospora thermoautotrophica]